MCFSHSNIGGFLSGETLRSVVCVGCGDIGMHPRGWKKEEGEEKANSISRGEGEEVKIVLISTQKGPSFPKCLGFILLCHYAELGFFL